MATVEHEADEPEQSKQSEQSEQSRRKRHHSSGKRHHRPNARPEKKQPGPVRTFLGKFWLELVALAILSLGIFLLVEHLQIKLLIWRTVVRWAGMAANAASSAWAVISTVLTRVERSDLVGIVLVGIALLMIAYSLRLRAIARHPDMPADKQCPQCHGEILRLSRRLLERVTELLLWIRIRRYGCSKCSLKISVWKSRRADD